MNPRETRSLPPATELQLEEFLRKSGSTLSLAEALVAAVKLWIEREKANAQPLRGYQWKILFLPELSLIHI